MKDLNDYTFDELVDKFTQEIHGALLKGGGEEMRKQVYMTLGLSIRWYQETHNGHPRGRRLQP